MPYLHALSPHMTLLNCGQGRGCPWPSPLSLVFALIHGLPIDPFPYLALADASSLYPDSSCSRHALQATLTKSPPSHGLPAFMWLSRLHVIQTQPFPSSCHSNPTFHVIQTQPFPPSCHPNPTLPAFLSSLPSSFTCPSQPLRCPHCLATCPDHLRYFVIFTQHAYNACMHSLLYTQGFCPC